MTIWHKSKRGRKPPKGDVMLTYCEVVLKFKDHIDKLDRLLCLEMSNGSLTPENWIETLNDEGDIEVATD